LGDFDERVRAEQAAFFGVGREVWCSGNQRLGPWLEGKDSSFLKKRSKKLLLLAGNGRGRFLAFACRNG